MLKIYHAKHTRGLRVIWTAEEIGVPYELRHIPFNPAALKGDEYLAVNKFGALPAIEDGGVKMTESGAICQYLTERHGKAPFRRTIADPDYPAYLQWTHAGEATLTPPLGQLIQHRIRPEDRRVAMIAEEASERIQGHLRILSDSLEGQHFILGEQMALPDVMIGYALHLAALLGQMKQAPARVGAYWERLQARPGYQKAVAA
jgi:glutathione S-transferase